jgi:phosphoserine phosphatase
MRWPPYKHVFLDCDSTLTAVEGIEALAEAAGKQWRVEVLTRAAMDGELDLEEVYAKRLRAIRPTRRQVQEIRQKYKQNVIKDARAVIAALQALDHKVYIISGVLADPVTEFGIYLGVPKEQIRAVDLQYDALSGRWWAGDPEAVGTEAQYLDYEEGALTVSDGKAQIVSELLGDRGGRSLLIGDGVSDLLTAHAVDLFVGFGGVIERPRVLAGAPCYIHGDGLAPLLALAAGPANLFSLEGTPHWKIATQALRSIDDGVITFQNERLKSKFEQAYQAVYSRPH